MLKHIYRLLIILTLSTITGCASMLRVDGPYEGKVIDVETNQPVEGAVVHATWYKKYLGGGAEYYSSYEVLTDKKGEFKIPGQGLLILSDVAVMMPVIFKAGYNQWPNTCDWYGLRLGCAGDMVSWKGDKVTIKLKRITLEERRKRSVRGPGVPNSDEQLFEREADKESIELGRGLKFLYSKTGWKYIYNNASSKWELSR